MGGETRTRPRQEVSYISRNLKVLAREAECAVLAAAQLSAPLEQRSDKRLFYRICANPARSKQEFRHCDVYLSSRPV